MVRSLRKPGHEAGGLRSPEELKARLASLGSVDVLCIAPEMCEPESLGALLATCARTPVALVLSCAHTVEEPALVALVATGRAVLLHKPFGPRELLEAIARSRVLAQGTGEG